MTQHIDGTKDRCEACGHESTPDDPVICFDEEAGLWVCEDPYKCNERDEAEHRTEVLQ